MSYLTASSTECLTSSAANVCNPTVNPANNRFNSSQGYTYDLSGNIVSDAEGRTYIYDAENKQKQVKNSANQTVGTYFFDGEQQRAAPLKQTHQEGYGIKDSNICL